MDKEIPVMLADAKTNTKFGKTELIKESDGEYYNTTVDSSDISIDVSLAHRMCEMQFDTKVSLCVVAL